MPSKSVGIGINLRTFVDAVSNPYSLLQYSTVTLQSTPVYTHDNYNVPKGFYGYKLTSMATSFPEVLTTAIESLLSLDDTFDPNMFAFLMAVIQHNSTQQNYWDFKLP